MSKSNGPSKNARTAGPSGYRDDPDAVSLHTTASDYEPNDMPQLPSYEDSVAADSHVNGPFNVPSDQFPVISQPPPVADGWRKHSQPTPAAAIGSETSIRMDQSLMEAPYLQNYIQDYLSMVPPSPSVRLRGWHWETRRRDNKKQQEQVTDFDIVFGLQQFLPPVNNASMWAPSVISNSENVYRGSWRKSRAPGFSRSIELGDNNAIPDLIDACRDFVNSKAPLKVFRVSRSVTGLDTAYLDAQLNQLIRSTHYRGHVEISFPVANKNVDIYSPHWVNHARISWIRWIFYLTFLWIFTWPILFFMTRWWTVYDVEWRFSIPICTNNESAPVRRYASISEPAWMQKHANLIHNLVSEKYQGDATAMPTNEDPRSRSQGAQGRMHGTGNSDMDTAVLFIQGGVNAWNSITRRGDAVGWGADEI